MAKLNAVVTGANRGLGLEIVKQLCQNNSSYGKVYALCRSASEALKTVAKDVSPCELVIEEGVDVMSERADVVVQDLFQTKTESPIAIDLLVHNAGAFGPPPKKDTTAADVYSSQSLSKIDRETMMYSFNLNTMAPLFLTKALLPNLKATKTGKVIIISSLMGSISDNTSGGIYAYRVAKAGVNMVGKSLAQDLKDDGIAVGLIHPGMVATGFGVGEGRERRPGQRDVDESVEGVLQAIEQVTLANTGCFLHGNYGEGVKSLNW